MNEWFTKKRAEMEDTILLRELQGVEDLYQELLESFHGDTETLAAWFRQRLPGIDRHELDMAVCHRLDHFVGQWIQTLEDRDFVNILNNLKQAEKLPHVDARMAVAERCKRDLRSLLSTRDICVEKEPDAYSEANGLFHKRIFGDDLQELWLRSNLVERKTRKHIDQYRSHFATGDIVSAIRAIEEDKKLRDCVGMVDRVELERNVQRFGAKGAHLLALQRALPGLNRAMGQYCVHIPPFQLLGTDLYDRWRNGGDIRDALVPLHQWIGGKEMMVRSSAVQSEDADSTTGAGIYESVSLRRRASLEELRTAVEQVYRSVDAQRAIEYRAQHGVIEEERMGIVLQQRKKVEDSASSGKGYINTVRPFAPGLLEAVWEHIPMRWIWRKDRMAHALQVGYTLDLQYALYFQVDAQRFQDTQFATEPLAKIGALIEMHYGSAMQIEFLAEERNITLLQSRALPHQVLMTRDVVSPENEELLHESDVIGNGDMVLDVLPPEKGNNNRRGVVIFDRSYFKSNRYIEQFFPKEGAVVILCPSREFFGHLETLCVENGLLCIFQSTLGMSREEHAKGPSEAMKNMLERMNPDGIEMTHYEDFGGHKRLHIVANGLKARIYAADEGGKS